MSGFESPDDCQSKLTGGTERESTVASMLAELKSVRTDEEEEWLAMAPLGTLVLK